MKKLTLTAVACIISLFACNKNIDSDKTSEDKYKISLNISTLQESISGLKSGEISGLEDKNVNAVDYVVYNSENKYIKHTTYTQADGLESISDTLSAGTYRIVLVAYRKQGEISSLSNSVKVGYGAFASWVANENLGGDVYYYTSVIEVNNSSSHNVILKRISGKLRVKINNLPEEASVILVTTRGEIRYFNLDRNFKARGTTKSHAFKASGCVYVNSFPHKEGDTKYNVTISIYKKDRSLLKKYTKDDVTVKPNCVTTLTGEYSSQSNNISLDTNWDNSYSFSLE